MTDHHERIAALRRTVDKATAAQRHYTEERARIEREVDEGHHRVLAADVGLSAIRTLREASTERVQQRITSLTTEGLRVVFDDPSVALEVVTTERGGVVVSDLMLRRGDLVTDPLEGNGGGLVADVAAMLRLVMVRMLTRRGLAPLLVLDEPFAALSAGKRDAMADTLEAVAAQLGIQVLCVTHAPEMVRGRVYRARWHDHEAIEAEFIDEGDDG